MSSYEEISYDALSAQEESFQFSEEERAEAQIRCLQVMEDEDI